MVGHVHVQPPETRTSERRIPVLTASATMGRTQSGQHSITARNSVRGRLRTRPAGTLGDFTPCAGLAGMISHSTASRSKCLKDVQFLLNGVSRHLAAPLGDVALEIKSPDCSQWAYKELLNLRWPSKINSSLW